MILNLNNDCLTCSKIYNKNMYLPAMAYGYGEVFDTTLLSLEFVRNLKSKYQRFFLQFVSYIMYIV